MATTTSFYHRKTCRACGSGDLELAFPLTPTPPADDYFPPAVSSQNAEVFPLDGYLCGRCGLFQLLDVVSPDILYRNFIYTTASSPGLVEHFQRYAEETIRWVSAKEGLAVDIGSNDGSLLRCFKNLGMRVLGVDPAQDIARKATEAGIPTLAAYFTVELAKQIRSESGPANLITINNTFANIDNLSEFVDGVRLLLAPDGVCVIETAYVADIVQNLLFDTIYHEHLSYFSVTALESFLRGKDLELVEVRRIATKGGSIRCLIQPRGGSRSVSESVKQLVAAECAINLGKPGIFRDYSKRLDAIREELLTQLKGFKAAGKTIAGYGASHTVTTLTYHFGLGDLISFLVDDNPRKQNTVSPGYRIPVYHPDVLLQKKPDYLVVMAWRFASAIMNRSQKYAAQGGRFVLPLPKVEVI